METQEEFYPMPLFVSLTVADIAHSIKWYREALGFRAVYTAPGPDGKPVMSHLRLKKYQDLMLLAAGADSDPIKKTGLAINVSYEGYLQALADQARALGTEVSGPATTPWNAIQVKISDPDGYQLTFSQMQNADLTFSEVMPPSLPT